MKVLVAMLLAAVLVAGCGEDETTATNVADLAVPWVDPDGEPPYIGSLSVNPADGALWMGTNTGLFRIEEGAEEPEKVTGDLTTPEGNGRVSEALVAEFTAPDTMIASGHPAPGEQLPSALGLIRTEDAGKTWTSISELGTADFHALELSDNSIVASLYQQAQVLASDDDGQNWQTRTAPMPLVALEVDPGEGRRWIASTERGIFLSADAGETWRQQDPTPNSRFAWSDDGAELFRIDPGGQIKVSSDGGEGWEDRGSTGGEPQAIALADGKVYVALLDGTVKRSDDGGATFTDIVKGG
jgi:hypothetical protein